MLGHLTFTCIGMDSFQYTNVEFIDIYYNLLIFGALRLQLNLHSEVNRTAPHISRVAVSIPSKRLRSSILIPENFSHHK